MKYSIPIMMRSGGGRIVLFSSVPQKLACQPLVIGSAKAGLEGLAMAAAPITKRGIRVNVLLPA